MYGKITNMRGENVDATSSVVKKIKLWVEYIPYILITRNVTTFFFMKFEDQHHS